jgi:biotin operon repressor
MLSRRLRDAGKPLCRRSRWCSRASDWTRNGWIITRLPSPVNRTGTVLDAANNRDVARDQTADRGAAGTSGRLLTLLALLQRRPDWTGPEMADRLGVDIRMVRRDIERVRKLGYTVESTRSRSTSTVRTGARSASDRMKEVVVTGHTFAPRRLDDPGRLVAAALSATPTVTTRRCASPSAPRTWSRGSPQASA